MQSVLFSLSEPRKTTEPVERKWYNKEPPPGFQSINTRQKCCVARDTVSGTRVILIVVVEYNNNLKIFLVFKSPGKGDEHSGFHSLIFRKPREQIIETTEAPSKWIFLQCFHVITKAIIPAVVTVLITAVPFGS